jgi:redox-sensitive bicupin YhaK (pirin superfamily)
VTQRSIDRVHGVRHLGGDSQVDRKAIVIPPGNWDLFDPFLMLAEDWFSAPGFDWHPHRGIETVTTVLDGALEHGDNRGNAGVLGPGDVQWMTAGGGIVHRELAHRDERAHTLQLWVNLPSSSKMVEARYQDFTPEAMGTVEGPGVRVRIVSGEGGPAENHWPITGMHVTVEPGRSIDLSLPGADRAFLYVLRGRLLAGAERAAVAAGDVAWTDPVGEGSSTLALVAPEGDEVAEALVYSGRPIREPVVAYGPFVMNTPDEIEQAYRDFRGGAFGDVPVLARL